MGTRNLTMVVLDNKYKVAQYGQWDGYPDGQGKTVAEFLMKASLKKFKRQVAKLKTAEFKTDIKPLWNECGADPDSDTVTMKVSDKFAEKYPQFSRDTGAKILDLIYNGKTDKVQLDTDFAGDSLFCEFAYVINLDREILEVYRGFNKEPLKPSDRFYGFKTDSKDYHPIKIWHTIEIKDLCVGFMDKLTKELWNEE